MSDTLVLATCAECGRRDPDERNAGVAHCMNKHCRLAFCEGCKADALDKDGLCVTCRSMAQGDGAAA